MRWLHVTIISFSLLKRLYGCAVVSAVRLCCGVQAWCLGCTVVLWCAGVVSWLYGCAVVCSVVSAVQLCCGVQAWDDVERKKKPVEQAGEYKRRIVLEQEKSAQSLAQIYEQEYLNATQVVHCSS